MAIQAGHLDVQQDRIRLDECALRRALTRRRQLRRPHNPPLRAGHRRGRAPPTNPRQQGCGRPTPFTAEPPVLGCRRRGSARVSRRGSRRSGRRVAPWEAGRSSSSSKRRTPKTSSTCNPKDTSSEVTTSTRSPPAAERRQHAEGWITREQTDDVGPRAGKIDETLDRPDRQGRFDRQREPALTSSEADHRLHELTTGETHRSVSSRRNSSRS